ncbi:MAG: protein-export chaperone SecB [Kiritimatiellia bacterium]
MNASALQLKQYIVTELSLSANRKFDLEKDVHFSVPDVVGEPICTPDEKNGREWQIVLKLKHSQSVESNSPYFFMIEIVGLFSVDKSVLEEKIPEFVRVNGASVLYSSAREILRSTMTMGPYLPILLPTISFCDSKSSTIEKKLLKPRKKARYG